MKKNIYEVFNDFEAATTKEDRKKVLLDNNDNALRVVLQGAFHPDIKFVFREIPPYSPLDAPAGMGYQSMWDAVSKMYIFTEGSKRVNPNLSLDRKKQIFIQLLEALEPKEAKVLEGVVLKNLKVKNLTPKFIEEVFPGLLS